MLIQVEQAASPIMLHVYFISIIFFSAEVFRTEKPVEALHCLFITCSEIELNYLVEVPADSSQNHDLTALWEIYVMFYLHRCLIQSCLSSVGVLIGVHVDVAGIPSDS